MTSTSYSRTNGSAVLPGTWAYVRNRGDIPDADKLDPAERYNYDQSDQSVRDQFQALALQPLTQPPAFLRFALGMNSDPLAHYEGEGDPGRFAAPGQLAGISNTEAAGLLGISEDTLQDKLGTFSGAVTLAKLPAGTVIYRTVGLTASGYSVSHGLVTNKLLLALKYKKHVIATGGVNGSGNNSTGANGEDIILEVPLGTVARDFETAEIEFEITTNGETKILARGGRGGQGNAQYKSATKQTPDYAQPGEPGTEIWKILELKELADVGLVGYPNAGKSSLLAALTAAKPEIANYPFTTLVPNLGIVKYRHHASICDG